MEAKRLKRPIKEFRWYPAPRFIGKINLAQSAINFNRVGIPDKKTYVIDLGDILFSCYLLGFNVLLCGISGTGKTYNIEYLINSLYKKEEIFKGSSLSSNEINKIAEHKKNKIQLYLDHFNLTNFHKNHDGPEIIDEEVFQRIESTAKLTNQFEWIIGSCCPSYQKGSYLHWGRLSGDSTHPKFLAIPLFNLGSSSYVSPTRTLEDDLEEARKFNHPLLDEISHIKKNLPAELGEISKAAKMSVILFLTAVRKNAIDQKINTNLSNTPELSPWKQLGEALSDHFEQWLKSEGFF